jgi:hypothetical protein
MKINEGFELREMCGEHIIIATGIGNIDFSKVISLNESAAYLWNELNNKEFTPATMAALLTERYDIDEATALTDATELANQWIKTGIATL